MKNDKILITARSFRKTEGPHLQKLRHAGYDLVNSPQDHPLEETELAASMAGVVGVIAGLDHFTARVFEQAKQLKVISRFGVGVDGVDLGAATRHGIVVTTTPGANTVSVAELTLGLILALARAIPFHDRAIKQGKSDRLTGVELTGCTLGLIGFGSIGKEVSRRAFGLGMNILFYDPIQPPPEVVASLHAEYRPIETLLAESDFVSLHLPLNDDTRNLLDHAALARMKPSAFLINTARGGLVDEQALYEALANGRLAGAACDAFAHEPPTGSPLLTLDNFIASPHAGSATRQAVLRMGMMATDNLLAVLNGKIPSFVANPEIYKR